jgi:hypothetical protein
VSTSVRSFVRSPPMMQPSYQGLSMVTRAGITVMTLRQSNNSPNRKVLTHQDQKKVRQVKSKVKSMLIIFFDIKGIVHKEFILAGQTVNSIYYCDILRRLCENVKRPCPKLWQKKNWLLHHNNTSSHTSFFNREHDYRSVPTFLCFSD